MGGTKGSHFLTFQARLQELLAGQGQLVRPDGKRSEITPDPDRFVGRDELARRVKEIRDLTHQRWQNASAVQL